MAVSARFAVSEAIVQIKPVPSTESHPPHPPNVPVGAAVNVTGTPLVNGAMQGELVFVQLKPAGLLVIEPMPVPGNVTEMVGPVVPPLPEGQTTFPVM